MVALPVTACRRCGAEFVPHKPWATFCSKSCRNAWHAADDGGLRGVVSSVRVMRRGVVSVVVRFGIEDRDRAVALDPGAVLEVLRQ